MRRCLDSHEETRRARFPIYRLVQLRLQRTWLSRRDLERFSYCLWPTERPTLHLLSWLGRLEAVPCSTLAPLLSPCRVDASPSRSLASQPNCRQRTCTRGTS